MKTNIFLTIIVSLCTLSAHAQVKTLTSAEWKRMENMSRPAVIDFYASWCGPCVSMAPVYEQLSQEFKGRIDFYRVDIDAEREWFSSMGAEGVPYLIFIYDSKKHYFSSLGSLSYSSLKRELEKLISSWNEHNQKDNENVVQKKNPDAKIKKYRDEIADIQKRKDVLKRQQEQTQHSSTSRIPNTGTTTTPAQKGIQLLYIRGGTFTMGAPDFDTEAWDDERPTHQVAVSSFYIGKYEVTQKEWTAIMGNNPSYFKGNNLPVESVSWDDIVGTTGNAEVINGIRYYENGFIYKLNAATGKKYRLPTEVEWEYAARGGSQSRGYLYSGSNNAGDVAWYYNSSGERTHNVGEKLPNELGIYDMSGNVYEWCSDRFNSTYYSSSPSNNPTGPASGSDRVLRGGSWDYSTRGARVSFRNYNAHGNSYYNIGFRLACSAE